MPVMQFRTLQNTGSIGAHSHMEFGFRVTPSLFERPSDPVVEPGLGKKKKFLLEARFLLFVEF